MDKFVGEGLTYDDVLLVPAYSEVLPRDVDIRSKFTRNIVLNVPIVSAAMDTVTGAELAISIAQQGGIGVIHKNQAANRNAILSLGPINRTVPIWEQRVDSRTVELTANGGDGAGSRECGCLEIG